MSRSFLDYIDLRAPLAKLLGQATRTPFLDLSRLHTPRLKRIKVRPAKVRVTLEKCDAEDASAALDNFDLESPTFQRRLDSSGVFSGWSERDAEAMRVEHESRQVREIARLTHLASKSNAARAVIGGSTEYVFTRYFRHPGDHLRTAKDRDQVVTDRAKAFLLSEKVSGTQEDRAEFSRDASML